MEPPLGHFTGFGKSLPQKRQAVAFLLILLPQKGHLFAANFQRIIITGTANRMVMPTQSRIARRTHSTSDNDLKKSYSMNL
jgi:hypothetical protein